MHKLLVVFTLWLIACKSLSSMEMDDFHQHKIHVFAEAHQGNFKSLFNSPKPQSLANEKEDEPQETTIGSSNGSYYALKEKQALIHYAIKHKDINAASFLIKNGASIESPIIIQEDFYGTQHAFFAIQKNIAPLHSTQKNGQTPLVLAILTGDPNIVELLLNAGANINAVDTENDIPLHSLIYEILDEDLEDNSNQIKILELLIQYGTKVNVVNSNNKTPLLIALEHNHELCHKPSTHDSVTCQPCVDIKNCNKFMVIKLLLDNNAEVPNNIFHQIANYSFSRDIGNLLLSKGAQINIISNGQSTLRTTLNYAPQEREESEKNDSESEDDRSIEEDNNFFNIIITLLECGANPLWYPLFVFDLQSINALSQNNMQLLLEKIKISVAKHLWFTMRLLQQPGITIIDDKEKTEIPRVALPEEIIRYIIIFAANTYVTWRQRDTKTMKL